MRHRHSGRQLNRNSSHRAAMFRNMTSSLVEHEIIKTTLVKAKELRSVTEPLITLRRTTALQIDVLLSTGREIRRRSVNCLLNWVRAMPIVLEVISAFLSVGSVPVIKHQWPMQNWWIGQLAAAMLLMTMWKRWKRSNLPTHFRLVTLLI